MAVRQLSDDLTTNLAYNTCRVPLFFMLYLHAGCASDELQLSSFYRLGQGNLLTRLDVGVNHQHPPVHHGKNMDDVSEKEILFH